MSPLLLTLCGVLVVVTMVCGVGRVVRAAVKAVVVIEILVVVWQEVGGGRSWPGSQYCCCGVGVWCSWCGQLVLVK